MRLIGGGIGSELAAGVAIAGAAVALFVPVNVKDEG
jgi:hypothetical protein